MKLKSVVDGLDWPALQSGRAAELMALQRQFDASQWWTPEKLREAQFEQLTVLAKHAYRNVPFYQDRLRKAGFKPDKQLNEEIWSRVPILTREEVRDLGEKLDASKNLVESHVF